MRIRHRTYWIKCYIVYYRSYLCLIVCGSPSNFSLPNSIPTSTLPYHTIPLPLLTITLSPSLPSPPLLHAPLLSLGYPERSAPTMALMVAVPASAPLVDTSP